MADGLSGAQVIGGIAVEVRATVVQGEAQKAATQIKQEVQKQLDSQPIKMRIDTTAAGGPFSGGMGGDKAYAMAAAGLGGMSPAQYVSTFRQAEQQKTQIVAQETRRRADIIQHETARAVRGSEIATREAMTSGGIGGGGAGGGTSGQTLFGLRLGRLQQMATVGFLAHEALSAAQGAVEYNKSMTLAHGDPHAEMAAEQAWQSRLGSFPIVGQAAQLGAEGLFSLYNWDRGRKSTEELLADAGQLDLKSARNAHKNAFYKKVGEALDDMPAQVHSIGASPRERMMQQQDERRRKFEKFADSSEYTINPNFGPLKEMRQWLEVMDRKEKTVMDRQEEHLNKRVFFEKRVASISLEATSAKIRQEDDHARKLERLAGREAMKIRHADALSAELDPNRRAGLEQLQAGELTGYDANSLLQEITIARQRHIRRAALVNRQVIAADIMDDTPHRAAQQAAIGGMIQEMMNTPMEERHDVALALRAELGAMKHDLTTVHGGGVAAAVQIGSLVGDPNDFGGGRAEKQKMLVDLEEAKKNINQMENEAGGRQVDGNKTEQDMLKVLQAIEKKVGPAVWN